MPRFGHRVLFVWFALVGSIVALPVPASAVTQLPLGSVGTVTVGDSGTACPAGHTCYKATVTCPALIQSSRVGRFAVSPVPTGESRGVVVLFSGGTGSTYWTKDADGSATDKQALVEDLYRSYGLRVVQVRWDSPGWFKAASGERAGPASMACRPATLLNHIRDIYYESISPAPTPAPGKCGFCVTGTSGGTAQAVYPLSRYGFATDPSRLVHALVPVSGPTHAAIDKRCLLTPGYADDKFDEFDRAYGYLTAGTGPCATHDAAFATTWNNDEVDSAANAQSSLPNTRVHVVAGETDTDIQKHAADWTAFVTGQSEVTEVVPAMGHTPTTAGITALKNALISGLTVVVPGAPTITSFTPSSGPAGSSVTLTGTRFGGTTAVKFNGLAATTFSVISQTQLTATVPTGATTGTISVTTPGGTATSGSSFTVLQPPAVTSFTPTSGPVGTSVTISGTNLTGATAVKFNATAATIGTNTATQITTTVPAGATTGKISVTTAAGTGASTNDFTVTTTGGSLTLTAKDAAATETDPGQRAKKCLVKVTLSATPTTQVTVTYSTAPNTATAPSDYTHQAGKVLTWPAGTTSLTKNAPVTLTADTVVEPVETFYVNLASPSGATIADAQAVCTITDDAGG